MIGIIKALRSIRKVHKGLSENLEVAYSILDRKEDAEMKKILDRFSEYLLIEHKVIPLILRMFYFSITITVLFPVLNIVYFYKKSELNTVSIFVIVFFSILEYFIVKYLAVNNMEKMERRITEVFMKYDGELPLNELSLYDNISDMEKIWDFINENEGE